MLLISTILHRKIQILLIGKLNRRKGGRKKCTIFLM